MDQITQLTTPETSWALVKLGMPVPEPEIGQVWYSTSRRFMICPNGVDSTTWIDIDDATPYHISNLKSYYTPAFTAPEIMAWAFPPPTLKSHGLMFEAEIESCEVFYSDENPAEAVALAVIKAMRDV